MKDIKDNIVLIRQIAAAAYAAGIEQIELIIALVIIGSGGNPYAAAIDATQRANLLYTRPAECSPETETLFQKTRWGLMALRGSVARSLGFYGWLSGLVEPELNLALGVKYLTQLMERYRERYGIEGVIAAYQTEAPRKIGERYINQGYVDAVLKLMGEYKPLAEEMREMLEAEKRASDDQETQGNEQGEADDNQDLASAGVTEETFIPEVKHTAETLNELTKAQLVDLAKSEFGLELAAQSKKETLVAQILVAQASTLDFTAEDLEGEKGVTFDEKDTAGESE